MEIGGDLVIFEALSKILSFFLAVKESNDDRTNIKTFSTEEFDKTDDFSFVGNEVVGADFGVLDGARVDAENDFGLVFEFLKKLDFEVGGEAGQSTGGVLIVDELATEFEVELVKHFDAFLDFLFLDFEILFGIKTFFHGTSLVITIIIITQWACYNI